MFVCFCVLFMIVCSNVFLFVFMFMSVFMFVCEWFSSFYLQELECNLFMFEIFLSVSVGVYLFFCISLYV